MSSGPWTWRRPGSGSDETVPPPPGAEPPPASATPGRRHSGRGRHGQDRAAGVREAVGGDGRREEPLPRAVGTGTDHQQPRALAGHLHQRRSRAAQREDRTQRGSSGRSPSKAASRAMRSRRRASRRHRSGSGGGGGHRLCVAPAPSQAVSHAVTTVSTQSRRRASSAARRSATTLTGEPLTPTTTHSSRTSLMPPMKRPETRGPGVLVAILTPSAPPARAAPLTFARSP